VMLLRMNMLATSAPLLLKTLSAHLEKFGPIAVH